MLDFMMEKKQTVQADNTIPLEQHEFLCDCEVWYFKVWTFTGTYLPSSLSQFIFSTILLESHTIKLDRSTNIMILHANFPTSLFSALIFLLCNRMQSAISEGISDLTFHSKHQGYQQHRLYLILFLWSTFFTSGVPCQNLQILLLHSSMS